MNKAGMLLVTRSDLVLPEFVLWRIFMDDGGIFVSGYHSCLLHTLQARHLSIQLFDVVSYFAT